MYTYFKFFSGRLPTMWWVVGGVMTATRTSQAQTELQLEFDLPTNYAEVKIWSGSVKKVK